jgi:hypothetical protein
VQLGAVRRWKGHVGEHVRLGLIHERGELRQLGAQLVGDPAPLCARRFGIVLREGRGDESRDDAPACLPACANTLRMKWILCRCRHKIHYADLRIMPTSA